MLKSTLSVVLSLLLAMSCFSQRMTILESTGDTLLSANETKPENTCVAKAEKSQQVTCTQYLSNAPFQGENSTNSYSVFYEFNNVNHIFSLFLKSHTIKIESIDEKSTLSIDISTRGANNIFLKMLFCLCFCHQLEKKNNKCTINNATTNEILALYDKDDKVVGRFFLSPCANAYSLNVPECIYSRLKEMMSNEVFNSFLEFNIPELEIEPFDYGNNSRTEFLRVKE